MIPSTLCYLKRAGKTLMLHRNKIEGDVHIGKWNGLGGHMEPGESPEDCVIREVEEESGLLIKDPVMRGVMTFPNFCHGKDEIVFLYLADQFEGTLKDCTEGGLAWIEDHKLQGLNLWPGDRLFMKWLEQPRFFSAKFIYEKEALTHHQVTFH